MQQQASEYEFTVLGKIGEGHYADLYKVQRSDGQCCAMKIVKIFEMSPKERRDCLNEARILSSLRHPNIIQCFGSFLENNMLYIVLELAEAGDLQRFVNAMRKRRVRFAEMDIWKYTLCVANALAYMHDRRIIHRDVKPENVYVTADGVIKLGDLGLGRALGSMSIQAMSVVGTPFYMSPEVIQGQGYTVKSDVWSLGCLVYELAMLAPAFASAGSFYELGQNITHVNYPPVHENYSPALRNLISSCLQRDAAQRLSAWDVAQIAKRQLREISREAAPTAEPGTTVNHSALDPDTNEGADGENKDRPPRLADDDSPLSQFEDLGFIGRGKFSEVRKTRCLLNGQIMAVKKVAVFDMDPKSRRQFLNEARILQSVPAHPNIIQYYDAFLHNNELFLLMELADCRDLSHLLEQHRQARSPMAEYDIWRVFSQLCSALRELHRHRVMHRDIKPQNVFLTKEGVVKLGDLGLGRLLGSQTQEAFSAVGTPFYMSPEAITTSGCHFKSDIWSLGCVLYEMAALQSPFYSSNQSLYALACSIRQAAYPPLPEYYSTDLRRLVKGMLQPNPDLRPDIEAVHAVAQEVFACFGRQAQALAQPHQEPPRAHTPADAVSSPFVQRTRGSKQVVEFPRRPSKGK